MNRLASRKLLFAGGLCSLATALMAAGVLPAEAGVAIIKTVAIVYLGAQGSVDVADKLKDGFGGWVGNLISKLVSSAKKEGAEGGV